MIKANVLKTSCSGSVTISANRAASVNSGNDGAGGGGAGGTVLMSVALFGAFRLSAEGTGKWRRRWQYGRCRRPWWQAAVDGSYSVSCYCTFNEYYLYYSNRCRRS